MWAAAPAHFFFMNEQWGKNDFFFVFFSASIHAQRAIVQVIRQLQRVGFIKTYCLISRIACCLLLVVIGVVWCTCLATTTNDSSRLNRTDNIILFASDINIKEYYIEYIVFEVIHTFRHKQRNCHACYAAVYLH